MKNNEMFLSQKASLQVLSVYPLCSICSFLLHGGDRLLLAIKVMMFFLS